MAGLLNYTTTIPAAKTISQMQQMLVDGGASSVAIHYDPNRRAAGLTFTAPTKYGIAIGMVQLDQIMLPFLEVGPGKTLYAAYQDQQDVLALTDGR